MSDMCCNLPTGVLIIAMIVRRHYSVVYLWWRRKFCVVIFLVKLMRLMTKGKSTTFYILCHYIYPTILRLLKLIQSWNSLHTITQNVCICCMNRLQCFGAILHSAIFPHIVSYERYVLHWKSTLNNVWSLTSLSFCSKEIGSNIYFF
jgi:hypothetical protein